MAWLENFDDKEALRIGRSLQRRAASAGETAQREVQQLAHRSGDIVQHSADAAGRAAHHLVEYARHEAPVLAQAAQVQAMRAGRALRKDPAPIIAGAVAIALLGSLVFRRRRATRS